MAIRIRPDEQPEEEQPNIPQHDDRPRGGGGVGNLTMFLPMLLGLFRKSPKLALLLVVIGGLFYFSRGGCDVGPMIGDDEGGGTIVSPFSMGLDMDPVKYGNTSVYEPLADNRKNPLPESVSLLEHTPRRLNQGSQGSCVGWSASYGARTILHARQTGADPNQVAFSPSYLYNQIALPGCQGTYLPDALAVMKQGGVLPFEYFRYDERSCSKKPSSQEKRAAQNFKIRDYHRLTEGRSSSQKPNMLGIKQNLAAGAPVVIGMMVGGSFMRAMEGREVWKPSRNDYSQRGFGGHAMCVIGYDDYKSGGAFQIMNSWGENWGQDGVGWVRYADFHHFTKEAYGLYPMGSAEKEADAFVMEFGLVKNKGSVNVAFKQTGDKTFRTVTSMRKGEDFKIEVTNSIDCYTYVFSQEANDGKVFTLFPYNKKHSPFCGIKGTRVFPRFESLYPDDSGYLDYMGILVTREPIDYVQVEQALNQVQGNMAQRMSKVLDGKGMLEGMVYQVDKSIQLGTKDTRMGGTYIVMEIDKE